MDRELAERYSFCSLHKHQEKYFCKRQARRHMQGTIVCIMVKPYKSFMQVRSGVRPVPDTLRCGL